MSRDLHYSSYVPYVNYDFQIFNDERPIAGLVTGPSCLEPFKVLHAEDGKDRQQTQAPLHQATRCHHDASERKLCFLHVTNRESSSLFERAGTEPIASFVETCSCIASSKPQDPSHSRLSHYPSLKTQDEAAMPMIGLPRLLLFKAEKAARRIKGCLDRNNLSTFCH